MTDSSNITLFLNNGNKTMAIINIIQSLATYNCGDFIVYKKTMARIGRILAIVKIHDKLKITIQRVLRFDELPNKLQSNNRKERSHVEVWLLDREIENAIITIELQEIVKHATVVILYNEDTINELSSIVIWEILYKHHGR